MCVDGACDFKNLQTHHWGEDDSWQEADELGTDVRQHAGIPGWSIIFLPKCGGICDQRFSERTESFRSLLS